MKATEELFFADTVNDLVEQLLTLLGEQSPSLAASQAAAELASARLSVQGVRGSVGRA